MKECPICMDDICLNVNCVTTECGHQFHTSCLMKNVAHNGFGCPYCRNTMAECVDEEEESEYESDGDEYEEDDDEEEEEEEEEPVGENDVALQGMRQLFRRVNNDIEEAAEERPRVVTAEEMTWTLIDAGYNMNDVVKAFMINNGYHLHYPDDTNEEDEFVEKIETHMEKVLHYQIPIVPVRIPVRIPIYPTSTNEDEEEQKEEEENIKFEEEQKEEENINHINLWMKFIKFRRVGDIAEPKTIKSMIYDDDEYL